MNGREDVRSTRAARALRAIEALPEPAPARADFRERLRREFAAGTLAPRPREAHAPSPAGPPRGVAGRIRPVGARRGPAAPWRWALAAAATIVAIVAGQAINAGPPWRVVSAAGEGIATVDGRPIPMNHTQELAAMLTPGARVRVPPGGLIEIASARTLAIQMTSETDAVVPPIPGRWFGRRLTGQIQAGEWRITTGTNFRHARLAITTPAAHVEVTGTTLAVICEPQGTCVCVYEGRVRVGRNRTDMASVEHGRRRYIFLDGTREPETDVMRPIEQTALAEFRDAMRPTMAGGR